MRILLVCSHGGHLTEMLELAEAFAGHELTYLTYPSARSACMENVVLIEHFAAKPTTIPRAVLAVARLMLRIRPRVVVSTGAEIAVPAFLLAKMFRAKTVFVESCARVTTPSMTGKMLYPFSDYFFVQWRELVSSYGSRAKYEGGLI